MERRYLGCSGRHLLVLVLTWIVADSGYVAQNGGDSKIVPGEGSYRYPDGGTEDVAKSRSYFISQLNFDLLEGVVVTGAADKLVFLNSLDLSEVEVYQWKDEENEAKCHDPTTSTFDSSSLEVRNFTCHNHIRVYQQLPSNSSLVLVCGTQSAIEPECRILQLDTGVGGEVVVEEFAAVPASEGLVSYLPQFSEFGQFRDSYDEDPVFLSAGFFDGENGVGRHFSISYKNITLATSSDPDSLETEELFRTINANNNWLTFPVTFVGVEKADYDGQLPSDYQFWFIFIREKPVTDIIYSHLVRVCRNDPGSMATTGDGARHFSTFMKARIFCVRDRPSTLEFTDTLDYVYNSITSFVFSKEGRYYGSDQPKRLLYGSFTSPSNGPVGSALCVYPADNSVETSEGAGRTKSVFDIFREDIASDLTSTAVENQFLECDPQGRREEDQQRLFINLDISIKQIGDDPILILDGVIVNHMVQDTVCVVTRGNRSRCLNQDVLFLGLDSGHVLKVVFGEGDDGEVVPVIAEDIDLDPEDPRNVTAMQLETVGGEKFLFVSTDTRVYKLPLQRCGRFPRCRCSDCVASRDPYCVYNTDTYMCELNQLSPETVDDKYQQNIHNGTVDSSCDCPKVDITPDVVAVGEGNGSVTFVLSATREVSVEVRTVAGTAVGGEDFEKFDGQVTVSGETSVSVAIIDDVALETDQEFSLTVSSDEVFFERSKVSVIIQDNDEVSGMAVRILFSSSFSCQEQLEIDRLTSDLVGGVVSGVRSKCGSSCSDFSSDHIVDHSLFVSCVNGDTWDLRLEGKMVSTETANVSAILSPSLEEWPSSPGSAVTTTSQHLRLQPYKVCTSSDNSCAKTSGLSSSSDNYSAGAFFAILVLLLVCLAILVVIVILIIIYLCRSKPDTRKKYTRRISTIWTGVTGVVQSKPQSSTSPRSVNKSMSYVQAQTIDPCASLSRSHLMAPQMSSLTSNTSSQISPPTETSPSSSLTSAVPRSADVEMEKNVAYSHCDGPGGGEKTDISGGQGNGETRTNDTTIL